MMQIFKDHRYFFRARIRSKNNKILMTGEALRTKQAAINQLRAVDILLGAPYLKMDADLPLYQDLTLKKPIFKKLY